MAVVAIEKGKVVKLFELVGFKTASKWTAEKLAESIRDLKDIADKESKIPDADATATRDTILAALEAGDTVELIAGAEPEAAAAAPKEAKAPKEPKPPKEPKAPKPPKEPKPPKAPKEPKPPKEPKAKVPTIPHYAGQVLAKHGVDKPVDDAMVAEVHALAGRENYKETISLLRRGRQIVQGFLAGAPAAIPAAPIEPAAK